MNTDVDNTDKKLYISDVSDSDLTEHILKDENGNKFCVKLPKDSKNIFIINTLNKKVRVCFRTKFGGKKYLETYIEV
jgi:hypothetical protein